MNYNFDEVVDRSNNYAAKLEEMELKFGRDDLIPMWIADMDFKSPEVIIKAIRERVEQGIYGYTYRPSSYFAAVSQWLKKRHGWDAKSEWMIHSPGVVPTISIFIKEFTEPGDKIIIQPPVYYPFFEVVKNNGRELVLNNLKLVDGKYVMDYEDLEEKAKVGAKVLILCSPHNPAGRVWTREELTKLGEICLKYNIKVIADEIHSDLVFWDNKHIHFASINEEFCKNSITCIAPSKTFNLAGLQASVAILPNKEDRTKFDTALGILDIKRNNCFNLVATEAAYRHGEEWLEQLLKYLEGNIEFVNKYCAENIPKLKPNRPEATYLVWIDCRELGMDKEELSNFMINDMKVALDEGYWFGKPGEGYLRINVACPRITLQKALDRIKVAVNSVK